MALVCVTGGTGFIASWLIKHLLESGYSVRATVRDPGDVEKAAHLRRLPNAVEKLELVRADLLEDGSFDAAVDGCEGVFHTASPVIVGCKDPEELLIKPAVRGTLNVLNACSKSASVRRVVLTSSICAVTEIRNKSEDCVYDESYWSDEDYCRENKLWYHLSKLLAEKAAWSLAEEKGLDLVVINPAMVLGTPLQPSLDFGAKRVLQILTETNSVFHSMVFAIVDVRDVAEAHIQAYKVKTASGRYLCAKKVFDLASIMSALQEIVPHHAFPTKCPEDLTEQRRLLQVSSDKIHELGISLRNVEGSLKEVVYFLMEKGLLH